MPKKRATLGAVLNVCKEIRAQVRSVNEAILLGAERPPFWNELLKFRHGQHRESAEQRTKVRQVKAAALKWGKEGFREGVLKAICLKVMDEIPGGYKKWKSFHSFMSKKKGESKEYFMTECN